MMNQLAQTFGGFRSMVPDCNNALNSDGSFVNPCGYEELLAVINAVINNLIVLGTMVAAIAFIYVGFKLMTSGGNTSAKDEAKRMLWSILKGFAVILLAWVVVYTITNVLLEDGYSLLQK